MQRCQVPSGWTGSSHLLIAPYPPYIQPALAGGADPIRPPTISAAANPATMYCFVNSAPCDTCTCWTGLHALDGLAVHLFFAVGAPGRQHFAVRIGQQWERQLLGVTEFG